MYSDAMRSGYTHITLLVDRSGSMAPVAGESSDAINKLVADQAAQPGKLTVSLYQFDSAVETVQTLVSGSEWAPYQLQARFSTALLDSMAYAIDDTGQRLRALPESERPERVFFVTVTDGEENASSKYKRADVSARCTTQADRFNWEFVFIGANLDAFAEAQSLGIRTHYNYNPVYTTQTYAGVSNTMSAVRSGEIAVMDSMVIDTSVRAEIDKTLKIEDGRTGASSV